jgi:hypothetical protein
MPEAINTFNGGLNQDIAKSFMQKDTYLDARNMRLVTNLGQSNVAIENVKGNNLSFSIPDVYPIYKMQVLSYYAGATTITISGQTSSAFTPVAFPPTGQELYDFIANDAAMTDFGVTYNISVFSDYIIIYSTTEDVYPAVSNALNITLTTKVEGQTNLIPIGFTTIRDDIYIYTTNNTTANPGGHDLNLPADPTCAGQIWKLNYNVTSFAPTVTLMYNGLIDFTTQHPIAPTATLGRYENLDIQRLYWTDFFNPLRSINVADANLIALDPSILDITPSVDFGIGILQKVSTGGVLPVGCYQLAYRLKNTSGSVTNFSELSNNVFITPYDEGSSTSGQTNWKLFVGAAKGTITNKQITWNIQDLDIDFERIEIAIIFRDELDSIPEIKILAEEPVPLNGEITITYTGSEEFTTMELTEFISLLTSFTHCKTIGTKDNRLFAGNVKVLGRDIDYDARAFRAFTSGGDDIILTNSNVSDTYDSTDARALLETQDTINDYSDALKGCYYKPGSANLGGSGTNISYEFGTVAIQADLSTAAIVGSTSPFRYTNPKTGLITVDSLNVLESDDTTIQEYPTNNINEDIKYTYYSSLFKGYQHEEIYRMAIMFYDKQKNPLFDKWIGDIKFPKCSDLCPAANRIYSDGTAQTTATDFSLSFVNGTTAYVNQLCIKFSISIPANIRDLVSGYSITRVKREKNDSTILATGILNCVLSDGGTLFLPDKQNNADAVNFPNLNVDAEGSLAGQSRQYNFTFDSPDFLLSGFPGFQSGDKIKIFRKLTKTINGNVIITGGDPYSIYKYYGNESASKTITLEEASELGVGETYVFSGASSTTWTFRNLVNTEVGPLTADALGSKTLICGSSNTVGFNSALGCTEGNAKKVLGYYTRTLTNQYGGNTYSQRSSSEYISCSEFRPIKKNNGAALSDTILIFGGDVFCSIYDNQKEIKNWGVNGPSIPEYTGGSHAGAPDNKLSHTIYFPATTRTNPELRTGLHINKDLTIDDGTAASGYETYDYNQVYSSENDILTYFPKPDPFIEQDTFDNRFYGSEIKINGELIDNWAIFKSSNYWDVEGSYGPINAMTILQDRMLFWQDRAFGILSINPRVLIQDQNSTSLQLGTGNVIQRHDYIATDIGSKHQWSICKSPYSVFFFDIINKRLYKYSTNQLEPLSDLKGMQSWFSNNLPGNIQTNDNPIYSYGVSSTYDRRYNEAIFTFIDGTSLENKTRETISYNETINEGRGGFSSFYDFNPDFYINDNRVIFSMNSSSNSTRKDIYLHDKGLNYCTFYGTKYDSIIKFIVNTAPTYSKIFDNLEWVTETDVFDASTDSNTNIKNNTWTTLRVYNDYQNTDTQLLDPLALVPNITRKERSWKLAVPRNRVLYTTPSPNIFTDLSPTRKQFGERIRDKYVTIDLTYDNLNDYRLVFHENKTIFRVSDR